MAGAATGRSMEARAASELEVNCLPPLVMPPSLLNQIEALVYDGRAVAATYVSHNLRRAHTIAYALHDQRVVGTVTLKRPRPEYVERLSLRTGLDLRDYLERGYTAVHPDYSGRGLATSLVRHLTSQAAGQRIYVVIAMTNLAAQAISQRAGTTLAARFISQVNGGEYGVWIQGPLPSQD